MDKTGDNGHTNNGYHASVVSVKELPNDESFSLDISDDSKETKRKGYVCVLHAF